jgi:hypothetical protein
MSNFIKPSSWSVGRKVRVLHPAGGLEGKIGVIQRTQSRRVLVRVRPSKKSDEVVMAYYNPAKELRLI